MLKMTRLEKVYRTHLIETHALSRIDIHVREGEFVARAGASNRARGLRRAEFDGNLGVGPRRSDRNRTQRLPHAPLKCGARDIEWNVEPAGRFVERCDDRADVIGETCRIEYTLRSSIPFLESREQRLRVIGDVDRADAAFGRRDEQNADRGCLRRIVDRLADSLVA